jgi:hypothetical protein
VRCCNALGCVATCHAVLQPVGMCCNVQHVATRSAENRVAALQRALSCWVAPVICVATCAGLQQALEIDPTNPNVLLMRGNRYVSIPWRRYNYRLGTTQYGRA